MHQVEQNITGSATTVIIGLAADLQAYRTVSVDNIQDSAQYIKQEYPNLKRLINVSDRPLDAIDAAFKTASGLYDVNAGKLTDNVYSMTRSDVSLIALRIDRSFEAFSRAAYDLARDIYMTGDLQSAATKLASASGSEFAKCEKAVLDKLVRVEQYASKRNDAHDYPVKFDPKSPELLRSILLRINRRSLIKCPTGYGKSSKIIDPCIEDCLKQGKKVLVISHRRSIIKNIDIKGLVDYEDVLPGQMSKARGLKVVVNSLIAARFEDFIKDVDLVVIDEAAQVLDHVFEGSMQQREVVYQTLKDVVWNAKSVVFSDADINDECLSLIRKNNEFIFCYEVEQAHTNVSCRMGPLDQVRAMAIKAAESGKNVLVAIDIARDAEALGKVLEKSGLQPLVITSKTAGWPAQAAFIADPNTCNHHVVIYSPAITSALSITSGHFNAHFGLFEGSVTPRSCIQMLRRDRTAQEFVIGIRNPQHKREELAQIEFEASGKSAFDAARKDHMARTGWLRDNIQFALPNELKRQGFKLDVIPADDAVGIEGFKANTSGRRAVKKDTATCLLNATPANEQQAKRTQKLGSNNETEHFAAIRYNAQQGLQRKELSFQDCTFWGEGIGQTKLTNYRKLFAKPGNDFEALTQELFKGLQGGAWTSEQSLALFDRIHAVRHQALLAGFEMPLPKRGANDVDARVKQATMTAIMSLHGLKTKRRDGGKSGYYYTVDPVTLAQMKGYTGL